MYQILVRGSTKTFILLDKGFEIEICLHILIEIDLHLTERLSLFAQRLVYDLTLKGFRRHHRETSVLAKYTSIAN
jgi:hypothetical protein